MGKFKLPEFENIKERNKFLVENEQLIFTQKKSEIKEADGFEQGSILINKDSLNKSSNLSTEDLLAKDTLQARLAINSTNIFDSHKDLHLPGMWDKSISENTRGLHLQEHSRMFKSIISSGDDLKVYTENVTWKSLGYNFDGKTQLLMHDSNIRKTRNLYMHEQYAKGYVTEHSVGMIYVKMVTCVNDKDYPVQYENWEKYYEMGVNKEAADQWGYFWAIPEAKYIEGSAVSLGSNPITPTIEIKNELSDSDLKKEAFKSWLLN